MSYNNKLTANYIFIFYVISAFISFIYCLTGFYNGDFIGEERTLSIFILTVLFLIYLLPYYIMWGIYKRFKYQKNSKKYSISVSFMFVLLIIYFIYSSLITLLFGVGKAEAEIYTAPSALKFIIQVTNRFPFGYFSLFVLFISRNKYYDFVIILMSIAIGLMSSSIGSFLFISLTYTVKYNDVIIRYLKTKFIYILLLLFFIPSIVSQLYAFRSTLRNSEYVEIYRSELIFGKLFGRFSSFSNFAVIVQELPFFIITSQTVDDLYFQKQGLKALIGFGEDPRERRPEYFMKVAFNQTAKNDPNSGYMISIPGNLLFSFIKSPFLSLLNTFNYYLYLYIIFFLAKIINVHNGYEYVFLITIYPLTSGVSNEFVIIITSLLFILILKYFWQIFFSPNVNSL